MSDSLVNALVSVGLAIVGVATLAVIVSGRAQTANVITAGGNAFATAIGAAVSPVSGASLGSAALGNFGGIGNYSGLA